MNTQPIKQHYVPICYLKSFSNFQNQMWRRKKDKPNARTCSPSQICYEIDLYTIQKDETLLLNNIKDRYIIEKQSFKKQENRYRKILTEVVKYSTSPFIIDKTNYHLFLEFIVTLKRRNPFLKNHLASAFPKKIEQEFKKNNLRDFLKRISKEVGDKVDLDAYLEDYSTNKISEPEKLNDLYLSRFIDIKDSILTTVTLDLYKHTQMLLFAPVGSQFITSDNPGFTIIGNDAIPFGGFGGLFQFYFPLTPTCCLLIDSSKTENKSTIEKTVYPTLVNVFAVDRINAFSKSLSNKSIFSNSKSILKRV